MCTSRGEKQSKKEEDKYIYITKNVITAISKGNSQNVSYIEGLKDNQTGFEYKDRALNILEKGESIDYKQ